MRRYSFELELAERLGVSTAAVYDRLYDLRQEQEKKHVNHHDGCYWVQMTPQDFPRIFPYLAASTVDKALRKLRNDGVVRKVRHGRVSWYTITKDTPACRSENVLY